MTITIQKLDQQHIDKAHETALKVHRKNLFFKAFSKEFIRLLAVIYQFPDTYESVIENDIHEILLKRWLISLFQADSSTTSLQLTLSDRINLVLNNISHLPGCKCKLRDLKLASKI